MHSVPIRNVYRAENGVFASVMTGRLRVTGVAEAARKSAGTGKSVAVERDR